MIVYMAHFSYLRINKFAICAVFFSASLVFAAVS